MTMEHYPTIDNFSAKYQGVIMAIESRRRKQSPPDTLEGRCPTVLRDFLEVRGIGVLNIRTIFGETAVRPRKLLKLMVNLEDHSHEQFSELDRLQVDATYQEILGVPIRKVTIPVAAGRNLAVLVEAAVRNFVLNQRGIDSTKEFIERQQKLMEDGD